MGQAAAFRAALPAAPFHASINSGSVTGVISSSTLGFPRSYLRSLDRRPLLEERVQAGRPDTDF